MIGKAPLLLAAALLLVACQPPGGGGPPAPPSASPLAAPASAPALRVPRARGPLHLDGELDEPDWITAARTGAFVDERGLDARPFSEARFLWDDHDLHIALYAADDDIEARVATHDGPVWIDDAFSLRLTPEPDTGAHSLIDLSALGVVSDAREQGGRRDSAWESGVRLGVDRDGTLGDRSDEDEEWVVEASIPLASLGLAARPGTRFTLALSRCDTPRAAGSLRRCGGWGTAGAVASGRGPTLELAPPDLQ